jgi:uncharacterized membrane protein
MTQIYRDKDIEKFVWISYLLQLFAIFSGGVFFVISAIIAYNRHDKSIGTIYQSHFRWQIKTLWYGLGGFILGAILLLVLIGGFVIAVVELWVLYRVIKGIFYLKEGREIENRGFF